jgi:hypothetical protein
VLYHWKIKLVVVVVVVVVVLYTRRVTRTYLFHGAGYSLKRWHLFSLSNNSLLPLWKLKIHYGDHKIPPTDPILSQPNLICPIDPYLPKVHLKVTLPSTPRSSQWSLTSWPPNQNPVNKSPLPMRATCPAHFILLDLNTLPISFLTENHVLKAYWGEEV